MFMCFAKDFLLEVVMIYIKDFLIFFNPFCASYSSAPIVLIFLMEIF